MWASPVAFDDALEWVATGYAARVSDPVEPVGPGKRQVKPAFVVQRFLRDGAVAGKDQVEQTPVQVIEESHVVRRLARPACGGDPMRSPLGPFG